MYRFGLEALKQWYLRSVKKPLVIRGARQVGKTQLVRSFAQINQIELVEVNLEELTITEFERRERFSLERALAEIHVLTGQKPSSEALLFIDEIQNSEYAYSRLRFFKEKRPDLPVVVAGSLLDTEWADLKKGAPVGRVEFLFLGPMTFGEFLLAQDEKTLWHYLKMHLRQGIPQSIHDQCSDLLRDYFYIGGMPEAVWTYVQGGRDFLGARRIQKEIVESYRQDVRKYTEGKLAKVILDVFEHVAFSIGEKTKYSRVSPEKSTYVQEAIDKLSDIFILQKVYYSTGSGLPLTQGEKSSLFKLFLVDVGIYNAMMDTDWSEIQKLSGDKLLNKGSMAEQFVAQHLFLSSFRTNRPRLHYWMSESKSQKAKVDFLIPYQNRALPIEVKAGKAGKIKSLLRFMGDDHPVKDFALRLDLQNREEVWEEVDHEVSVGREFKRAKFSLLNLPLYAVELLEESL